MNTVNDELDLIRETTSSHAPNSDLGNLLSSVDIPVVIVTSELNIRAVHAEGRTAVRPIASDIGRPIGEINPNFACDDLESVIRGAIERSRRSSARCRIEAATGIRRAFADTRMPKCSRRRL